VTATRLKLKDSPHKPVLDKYLADMLERHTLNRGTAKTVGVRYPVNPFEAEDGEENQA
jgi:hypothetical protein